MEKTTYDRETLARWDREHLWHPFTQMQGFREEELLIISRGQGNYLFDLEGNRYLDGVSSLWANLHGHRRPELDRAVTEQLGQVAHSTLLGLAHPSAIMLARRLAQVAPAGLTKVFFSDDGSTAVEVALKLAFQYWQNRGRQDKRRFLKLSNSYHGDTLGSVSVGGIPLFHQVYHSLLFDTLEAPSPYCYRCPHRGTAGSSAWPPWRSRWRCTTGSWPRLSWSPSYKAPPVCCRSRRATWRRYGK